MSTDDTSAACRGSGSNDLLGQGSEAVQPVAYLYHDAATAEIADPLTHSTILVMRRHRLPSYRNETPLITLAQAAALVAAERERWSVLAANVRCVVHAHHVGALEASNVRLMAQALDDVLGPNAEFTGPIRP